MRNKLLTLSLLISLFLFPFIFYSTHTFPWQEYSNNIEDKELIINNIHEFFLYKEDLNYFDDNVQAHFLDVRNLHSRMIIVFIVSIILSAILMFNGANYFVSLKYASILLAGLWVLFFLWAVLDFSSLFSGFHKLFFEGNYIFSRDNLVIQLFPPSFFYNMLKSIALSSLSLSFFSYMLVYKRQ